MEYAKQDMRILRGQMGAPGIAGGEYALSHAVEGAEDDLALGRRDLEGIGLTEKDMVIGIAASGRTPYVIGALRYAAALGCRTAALSNHPGSAIAKESMVAMEPDTGAEVLTGSTRLKAGTAQKMILNMISTATMCGMGHVYQNLMVDVRQTNEKLRLRAKCIVMQAADVDEETAEKVLAAADGDCKTAITMLLLGVDSQQAQAALHRAGGNIRTAAEKQPW